MILHIGAHKTATTHLQRSLERQQREIRERGIACLIARKIRRPDRIFAPLFRPEGSTQRKAKALERFREQIKGATKLVMSEENISGSFRDGVENYRHGMYPHATERISFFLTKADLNNVTLMMSLRDPAAFLSSAYSEMLRSGRWMTFEHFVEKVDFSRPAWLPQIQGLTGLNRVRRIIVWRYEDYHDIFDQIIVALLGPEFRETLLPTPKTIRPGYSREVVEAILAEHQKNRIPEREDRIIFARETEERISQRPDLTRPAYWPADALAAAAASYQREIEQIVDLPKVHMLRPDPART